MSNEHLALVRAPRAPTSPSAPPSPLLPSLFDNCSPCNDMLVEISAEIQKLRTDVTGLVEMQSCLKDWMEAQQRHLHGQTKFDVVRNVASHVESSIHQSIPSLLGLNAKQKSFRKRPTRCGSKSFDERPSNQPSRKLSSSSNDDSKVKQIVSKSYSFTDPVSKRAKAVRQESQTIMQNIVRSSLFELCSLALVMSNALVVSVQVQVRAARHGVVGHTHLIDVAFSAGFTIELLMRLTSDGSLFLRRWWNVFDCVIVFFMLLELVIDMTHEQESLVFEHMGLLRLLRFLRLVRILRVLRVLQFFTELRVMILSIIASVRSLFWAMCVLAIVFYIFGIVFTQAVIDHCEDIDTWSGGDIDALRERFGSLERSILSLFESMSGGISWGELVVALQPLSLPYTLIFLCFISLAVFAIVNIVTGVFVENAMQNSRRDRELVITDHIKKADEYRKNVVAMFDELDANDNGAIGVEEFQQAMEDERVVAYFTALGIDISDAVALFSMLDRDHQGSIDIEEFFEGCNRLKGAARSMELEKLLYSCQWMMHSISRIENKVCS